MIFATNLKGPAKDVQLPSNIASNLCSHPAVAVIEPHSQVNELLVQRCPQAGHDGSIPTVFLRMRGPHGLGP